MPPYNHATHAGNRGDTWKHFALLTVLEAMLGDRPPASLRYLDTHAGAGVFRLERRGEWTDGVGAALAHGFALSGHPYVRLAGDWVARGRYPGSWRCVLEVLRDRSVRPVMHLCETDPGAADAAARVLDELEMDLDAEILLQRADGFGALRHTPRPDLVLIDPPYVPDPVRDRTRAVEAMLALHRDGVTALAWYPIITGHPPTTAAGLPCFEAQWSDDGFAGCGVIASGNAGPALVRGWSDLSELATGLDAVCRVRRGVSA